MRLIVLFCCVFFSKIMFSQEKLTYSEVDATSYEQFLMEDFKCLKRTISDALDNGIDYYTLRMRAGIVAYNKANYAYAVEQFKVANSMNPNDTIAQEYLYYSYSYSDQSEEAKAFAYGFSESMKEKINFSGRRMDNLVITSGYNFNNNESQNEYTKFLTSNYKNVQTLFNESSIKTNVLIKNTLFKRLQLYNGLTYFNLNAMGSIELSMIRKTEDYKNGYFQYNLGLGYQFKNGWLLSGGFGYYKSTISTLTLIKGQINPMLPPPINPPVQYITVDSKYNNFSTSISFGKRFKYIYPVFSFHISDFYNTTKTQEEFNLTIYPFGNTKLYLTSGINYINDSSNSYVLSQKIGAKLTKNVLIDVESAFGDFSNRITANGFNSFNSMDKILSHSGASVHFLISPKFEIITSYYFQQRQANMYQYKDLINCDTETYKYNNNNLNLTLKWNF